MDNLPLGSISGVAWRGEGTPQARVRARGLSFQHGSPISSHSDSGLNGQGP